MFILKDNWFKKNNLEVVDYQTRVIMECINSLNTQELSVVMGATPSAGKTIMSIYIANHYISKGSKVLVLTHGTTVIRNNYSESVKRLKNDFTYQIFEAGDTMQDVDMLITLPQSVRKLDLSKFDMIIVDEAHERYFGKEIQDIIKKIKPTKQLLLTGTPSPFIKSEINFPIHIISMQEAYQQGRINDMMVHLCSSTYDIRDTDFSKSNDITTRGNNKLNKKDTEATLNNLLGELQKKLTNVFDGKIGSTIHNIFNWSLAIKEMGKTLIAANSVEQARYIQEYFNNQNINTLLSTHEDDVDSEQIDLFKNNPEYKILVVVRRGVLGFDMPSLINVIDMTASRNLDRVYQLMSRVVRKSNDVKMKHFIKMAVPNTEAIYEFLMTATLCLMSKEYISKYDGRNFGQFEIPVVPEPRQRTDGGGDREGGTQRVRTNIRPINILGVPVFDFFEKVFHKDGKVLNTHSLAKISNVMYELGVLGDRVPSGYWTYELCDHYAKLCCSRIEFKKKYPGAYNAALKNGWVDEICAHMKPLINSHTLESIKEKALTCKSKREFRKKYINAYNSAMFKGIMDEVCAHMESSTRQKHTLESIKEKALTCKSRSEFKKKYPTAYGAALSKGCLDEVCAHMKPLINSHTFESIKEKALECKSKTEFQKKYPSAYMAALRIGCLNEICAHMEPLLQKHTVESIKEKALTCTTRGEFQKKDPSAYMAAVRKGCLDEVCAHMKPLINSHTLESIKEKALTCKSRSEFYKKYPGAYGAAQRIGCLDEVCAHMESLVKKHTFESIKEKALTCKSRGEFRKKYPWAYQVTRINGWLDIFFPKK
jgi:superfamily II DNA or RNA helicase